MNTTGLPELWHSALAILSRQTPFMQIMMVTLAALFVVMALEGFRSSLRAIWHAHRTPQQMQTPGLDAPIRLASPAAPARRLTAKARALSPRPKMLEEAPRLFRSPRPTIRRQIAYVAATTPAESAHAEPQ